MDACQVEEMGMWFPSKNGNGGISSTATRSSFWLAVVQVAALLRLGEYGHARHVYRRWKDPSAGIVVMPPWTDEEHAIFQSWWQVGQAMMTDQLDVVWTGLWDMMQVKQSEPLRTYAQEVADAYYHKRLLPILARRCRSPSNTFLSNNISDPLMLGRQVPALSLYLQAYQGWKCEGNVWSPPPTIMANSRQPQAKPLSLSTDGRISNGSNKELLQLIAFLENPHLQA